MVRRRGLQILRGSGVALSLMLISACAAPPLATFDLSAPTVQAKARQMRAILVVQEPIASAPLDGDRIVVRVGGTSIAVVKGAQWADRLPRLLQNRLIQTFENAQLTRSISRPGDGIAADRSLAWEIRRFEVQTEEAAARVEVSVKILDPSGRVVAAQIFSASAPGSAGEGAAASAALNEASNDVLRQIVAWASSRL
jgi:cholesterol transport system auxiliary component